MSRLLLVDDDPRFLQVMSSLLKARSHEIVSLNEGDAVIKALEEGRFDLAIFDLHMGQTNGLDLLQYARAKQANLPVIMMTAYGTVDTALQALKLGAFDYVTKPFKVNDFMAVVDRALKQTSETTAETNVPIRYGLSEMVTASTAMVQISKLIEQIAPSDVPILFSGAAGVGKRYAAKALHGASRRVGKPFISVQCAGPTEVELSRTLFGFVRGAFDGADEDQDGVFIQANKGTVVLENVSALPQSLQKPVQTLLKKKTMRPLGVDVDISVDVRLLATTTDDIADLVTKGKFDSELYTRITAISIEIPSLCARREDIVPLARHFVRTFASSPQGLRSFAADARGLMMHYAWPGNVQELYDTVKAVVESTPDVQLTSKHFPQEILDAMAGKAIKTLNIDSSSGRGLAAAKFIRSQSASLSGQNPLQPGS